MKNTKLLGTVATLAVMLLAGVANAQPFGATGVLADIIVPEPASLSLLAIGGLALLLRRRK